MTIQVEFPDQLLIATKSNREQFKNQVLLYTLGHLYQDGKISAGYGAQLFGCDKLTFYRLLSENGFAVIDYDEDEWMMEAQPLQLTAAGDPL